MMSQFYKSGLPLMIQSSNFTSQHGSGVKNLDFLHTVKKEHLELLKDLDILSSQYDNECGVTQEVTECFIKFLTERAA